MPYMSFTRTKHWCNPSQPLLMWYLRFYEWDFESFLWEYLYGKPITLSEKAFKNTKLWSFNHLSRIRRRQEEAAEMTKEAKSAPPSTKRRIFEEGQSHGADWKEFKPKETPESCKQCYWKLCHCLIINYQMQKLNNCKIFPVRLFVWILRETLYRKK